MTLGCQKSFGSAVSNAKSFQKKKNIREIREDGEWTEEQLPASFNETSWLVEPQSGRVSAILNLIQLSCNVNCVIRFFQCILE